MVMIKKTSIFKGFRGGPTLQGGRATFPMGVGGLMGNFYRNPYNL